jgi:hypothetical protein
MTTRTGDLCPIVDALPGFDRPPPRQPVVRDTHGATDHIEGDELQSLETTPARCSRATVHLSRGDQSLRTDKLTYNRETVTTLPKAASATRIPACACSPSAPRQPGEGHSPIEDLKYQLTDVAATAVRKRSRCTVLKVH